VRQRESRSDGFQAELDIYFSYMSFSLTSPAFENGGMIPAKYTCDENRGLSPALVWSGAPEGTKSFVLIMDDPDIPQVVKEARGIAAFDHWTLFNIPPEAREILEGRTIGTPGANTAGNASYTGPCPPPEYEPSEHRYFFRLYALNSLLPLPVGATKEDVLASLAPHLIEKTELIGRYSRK
jgi:hypothetical protein